MPFEHSEKPIRWTVGTGANAVTMGLFGFNVLDDVDPSLQLGRGVTICPLSHMENQMRGLYDPEQGGARLDFSENVGTMVAVASGSEKPSDLTEAQLDTARNYLNLLQEKLIPPLDKLQAIEGVSVETSRKHPGSLLQAHDWDLQQSTEFHAQWDMTVQSEQYAKITQLIIDKAAETQKSFNRPASAEAPTASAPGKATTSSVARAKSFSERARPAENAPRPVTEEDVIATLFTSLMTHFRGDDKKTSAARNDVMSDIRALYEGRKPGGPTTPGH